MKILRKRKKAISWQMVDINGINPLYTCTRYIWMRPTSQVYNLSAD